MYSILRQFQNNLLVGGICISPQFLKNYRSPEIGIPYNGHLQTIILFAEFFYHQNSTNSTIHTSNFLKQKHIATQPEITYLKLRKVIYFSIQYNPQHFAQQCNGIYIDLKKFINVLKHPRLGFGTDKLQGCDVKRGLRSHQRWARELVEERVTQTEISVILPVSH